MRIISIHKHNTIMKTKKQVLIDHEDYATIINEVINRIGVSSVQDVNNHGVDGGFNGFIYYGETHRFAMRHREQIISLLKEDAEGFDSEIIEMVSGFGYFSKGSAMGSEDKMELYNYIGGGPCEQSTITNLMAWYAAETVCRYFDE